MDFQKYHKLISIVVIVIVVIGGVVFNIIQQENGTEEAKIDTISGTLIMNNPGLSAGWHISYEKPGKPGLIKKIIKTNETNCSGSKSECAKFFEGNEELVGTRAEVVGNVKNNEITLKKINFYSSSESSYNFEFNDFKTENLLNKDSYTVNFETNRNAGQFKSKRTE